MESRPFNDACIDFVITWVDGSDPEWRAEKALYSNKDAEPVSDVQNDERARYEDWDLLRYWFRGVEKFAPWVNRIHFVTWGHLPSWLNTEHPKLNIVKHEDYIPAEYLPTFSSRPIDLNLHRIKDLAEQFVYFNDDMYVIAKTQPEDFFKKGLPCATAGLSPRRIRKGDWFYAPLNNIALINEHFSPRKSIAAHPGKWFNAKYGQTNMLNLVMLAFPEFFGLNEYHLPYSLLKSTYEEVWAKEPEILEQTSSHRFRHHLDVSQWLMENWQLASGNFTPRSSKIGKAFQLSGDISKTLPQLYEYITKQRGKVVCVNDGDLTPEQAEEAKNAVHKAFHELLPDKSSFER